VSAAPVVLVDIADRVATVTLNRPAARNALSNELLSELPRAIAAADADDGVDVIIVTGADPAFCAGLDLREVGAAKIQTSGAPTNGDSSRRRGPFPPTAKPVIGAINGAAVTGGLEVALACDWLIASERARFADTHARVGVMPGWGLTVLLPQAVGVRRARHMSATGNFVDAPTALAWGLVNMVVPHAELLATCRALAADIISNDQAGVRQMMATYDQLDDGDGAAAWERERRIAHEFRLAGNGDPAEVERRRTQIIGRGRTQAGTEV
jgi:enoyl-CoA hydratase